MDTQLTEDEQKLLLESQAATLAADALDEQPAVRPVEIAAVEQIKRGKLPGLEMVAERYSRAFRSALSTHLGRVSSAQVKEIQFCRFSEFYKTLELPSNLHLFRLNPLPSQALLVFSNPLVHQFVEILFGAGGMPSKTRANVNRELSAIEQRLITKVALLALDCFTEAWTPVKDVENIYISSESNPLALQAITASENVAVLRFEVELGTESFPMTICLPFSLLAPVREKLEKGAVTTNYSEKNSSDSRLSEQLSHAHVTVRVELAQGKQKVRDILALEVGDILELSTAADEAAKVYVEGSLKFRGIAGEAKGSKVLKIQSAVPTKNNNQ